MIYTDTETLGLCGPVVLIQWAEYFEDPHLYNVWKHPIQDTLDLIDYLMLHEGGICGFKLTFDCFQLNKLSNMLELILADHGNIVLEDVLQKPDWQSYLIRIEADARDVGAVRPVTALDLMLLAQKGPYQKCMDREPITIKRIPTPFAGSLVDILNQSFDFDPILFADRAEKAEGTGVWKIFPSEDRSGNILEGLNDIRCIFRPSLTLKDLAIDMGLTKEGLKYKELGIDFEHMPTELGFAPFAQALFNVKDEFQQKLVRDYLVRKNKTKRAEDKLLLPFFGTWPHFLKYHIDFWETNQLAREYAANDIHFTRGIHQKFGSPPPGDDDSMLATCVASCRWKGYALDIEGIEELRRKNSGKITGRAGEIFSRPAECMKYIKEAMSDFEKLTLGKKTDKITLEKIAQLSGDAGERAKEILAARKAQKEIEVLDKLLIAGRFHASFNVIGALSSRMSGADDLNPQGINKKKYFRGKFPLAFPGYVLCGGDFESFEVTIFEAVSNDVRLREDLLSGKKIHGLFGTFVYPDMTYDEIVASSGTKDDKYTRSKSALFAMLYGGEAQTLMTRLGVKFEDAQRAYENFLNAYPGAKAERMRVKEMFSPLVQDEATNRIYWNTFNEYVESLYGFRRYFTIEFYAARKLFDLANNLPKEWSAVDGYIVRSENRGKQTYSGAIMSALYAAAFNIQSSVFRQAANHRIQSSGAQVTKMLERRIWELQPPGRNKWVVQPMNVHDEIMCPALEHIIPKITEVVQQLVKEVAVRVPLVGIDWHERMQNWAEK